jgi:hypothetical protein
MVPEETCESHLSGVLWLKKVDRGAYGFAKIKAEFSGAYFKPFLKKGNSLYRILRVYSLDNYPNILGTTKALLQSKSSHHLL